MKFIRLSSLLAVFVGLSVGLVQAAPKKTKLSSSKAVSRTQARTRGDSDIKQVGRFLEQVRAAQDPVLAASRVLKALQTDADLSDEVASSFFEQAGREPLIQQRVARAKLALDESERLGAPLAISSGARNLRVKLRYFIARLKAMESASIPGRCFGSDPVLDEASRGKARELILRIQAELVRQHSETEHPEEFLNRVLATRALGLGFLALSEEFERAGYSRVHEEIPQETERYQAVADWIKGVSFGAISLYAQVRALPSGLQASRAAGASTQSVLCALDRAYADWAGSGGTASESDWSEKVAACAIEGAVGAAAGGASVRAYRWIDGVRASGLSKSVMQAGAQLGVGSVAAVSSGVATAALVGDEDTGPEGAGAILSRYLSAEVDRYTTPEGWATLAAEALISRRVVQSDIESRRRKTVLARLTPEPDVGSELRSLPERSVPVARSHPGTVRDALGSEFYFEHGLFLQWNTTRQKEGFKLHVSATAANAPAVTEAILPVLRRLGVPHKVVRDAESYEGRMVGSQRGKFITIYPENPSQAAEIARLCDDIMLDRGFDGYQVPAEKVIGRSGTVTVRYGGFTKTTITAPNGQEVPDVRGVEWKPEWIADPFSGMKQP